MCLAINKNIDFRKILTKVWGDIQKPIRIAKKPTYLCLYTLPNSLNAKVLPMVRDTLSIHAEYSSFIYITSNPNITTEIKQLPNNGETLNDKSAVLAYIETWFLINDLEKLVADKVVGRSFTFKDYSATVDDLKLTTEGQNLKANVQLNQGLDAEVVIIGKPVLTSKKELKIEEFSYKVISDDQMAEAANWLPKPLIESYLTSMMTLDVAKFLNNLDSIANAGVSKSKLGNKIATHLDFSDVKSYQQQIVGDTLKWVFYLEGSAGLTLKKDAFKKKKSQQL